MFFAWLLTVSQQHKAIKCHRNKTQTNGTKNHPNTIWNPKTNTNQPYNIAKNQLKPIWTKNPGTILTILWYTNHNNGTYSGRKKYTNLTTTLPPPLPPLSVFSALEGSGVWITTSEFSSRRQADEVFRGLKRVESKGKRKNSCKTGQCYPLYTFYIFLSAKKQKTCMLKNTYYDIL